MIDNIYNITPQQINYILELNIERNFQRASDKCFVTQPTLSMQVKKAEELLGFLVFDRSRSPIELTPTGKELIPILQDIQTEYTRVLNLKRKRAGIQIEELTVGIIPTISAFLLIDIFEDVMAKMPNVQIKMEELKSDELIMALNDKKIDLGIMAGPFNERRVRTVPLFTEEIKLFFPSSNLEMLSPEDLENQQPWLLSEGNCLRTQMVNFCRIANTDKTDLKWNYAGGNIDLLMQMVELNGGYTLIPENYHIPEKKLKRLFDKRTNEFPARVVIALMLDKSLKKEMCESLIRIIQFRYSKSNPDGLNVLSWK
jgi:LysR family hydrogen peroxide-inducible transcriptional activator